MKPFLIEMIIKEDPLKKVYNRGGIKKNNEKTTQNKTLDTTIKTTT